jgi:hypothetical protein
MRERSNARAEAVNAATAGPATAGPATAGARATESATVGARATQSGGVEAFELLKARGGRGYKHQNNF